MPITHAETEISGQPIGVTGPLTDTELRATPVQVAWTTSQEVHQTDKTQFEVNANLKVEDVDVTAANPVPTEIIGTVATTVGGTALATVTTVAVSTTVATLSASNAAKSKVIIHNEGGTLYVKLGTGATSSNYSYRLTANSVVEIVGYTGEITAIKQTGTTNAQVTEVGI